MDHEKIENQFPEDGKIYIHESREKCKSSFALHTKQKCPFTRHQKSIGDPLSDPINPTPQVS